MSELVHDNVDEDSKVGVHSDDPKYERLIELGFEKSVVEQALQQYTTLDDAIQWCVDYPTGKTNTDGIKRQLPDETWLRDHIRRLILQGRGICTEMTVEEIRTQDQLLYYASPLLSKFEVELRRFLTNPRFNLHEKLRILASGKVKDGQFDESILRKSLQATEDLTKMVSTRFESIDKSIHNLGKTLENMENEPIQRDDCAIKSEKDAQRDQARLSRKMDKVGTVINSIVTAGLAVGTGLVCPLTLFAGIPLTIASFGAAGLSMIDDSDDSE